MGSIREACVAGLGCVCVVALVVARVSWARAAEVAAEGAAAAVGAAASVSVSASASASASATRG